MRGPGAQPVYWRWINYSGQQHEMHCKKCGVTTALPEGNTPPGQIPYTMLAAMDRFYEDHTHGCPNGLEREEQS